MNTFNRGSLGAALWAEALKARRSRVPWLTALGFSMAPLVAGLFMIILKDPAAAQSMGLISTKAQLTVGVADWPTFLGVLSQTTAVGGSVLFSFVTAWVFGREFSDHTAKELLATPTPRGAVVAAKLLLIGLWSVGLVVLVFGIGLLVGAAVGLPGWSTSLLLRGSLDQAATTVLVLALMPPVALLASAGRGYLPPLGWVLLTVFLAQILAATGWGAWFPWSVPPLFSGIAGPRADQLGPQSYIVVALTFALGLLATCAWWYRADHTR
jgi:ABC-2 type transport system permease protein